MRTSIITVCCKDNTAKLETIRIGLQGRRAHDQARDFEIAQLRLVGSLSWIARQCRPDLAYGVSRCQSVCTKALVSDLQCANKLEREAAATSLRGHIFKSGLFLWPNMDLVSITDASFENEK